MKRYRVTVNGQNYDVAVEEVGGASPAPASGAVAPAHAPNPPAPIAPAAAAPPPFAGAPSGASGVAGAVTIKAPMPGTVLSYKVSVGQSVGRGDVLLILEAMKMENEIVATQVGTVVAIRSSAGASVNTGDPLVELA
jgi:glutaconyl-CoA decarboxylase